MAATTVAGRLLGAPARAAAGPPRQPDQRAHPREGARARAAPLRGRRRLRQDAERAARGVGAPALARVAGLRHRPERGDARRTLGPPVAPLPLERPRHRGRLDPGLPRRGAPLGRVLPRELLARPRGAQAQLPRVDPHARQPRQGGEALRPRAPRPRPLPGPLPEVLRRGPPPRGAPHGLRAPLRPRWRSPPSTACTSSWPRAPPGPRSPSAT